MSQKTNKPFRLEHKDVASTTPVAGSDDKQVADAISVVQAASEKIEEKSKKMEGGISELKTALKKAHDDLDKLETKNQEIIGKLGEERKAVESQKERMDELEVKLTKLNAVGAGGRDHEKKMALESELKHLDIFAVNKDERLGDAGFDTKYLRSDSNPDGGFIMQESYDDMILKKITEISPMRSVCRNKRIDGIAENMFARETLVQAYWVGEGEAPTESASTYSAPKIPVHSLMVLTKSTNTALNGSRFDLENEITSDFVEARSWLEGTAFVNGDGVSKPKGFNIDASGIDSVNSGSATSYDFDALIGMTGLLKKGYNPMYGMNRQELAFMRTLKDGAGAYIWRAGNLGAGVPNAINGYSYMEIPGMPTQAAGAYPVILADFMRLYTIVDAWNAIFLRNPYISRGNVEFSLQGWVGGQVVQKEAGIRLKCAS